LIAGCGAPQAQNWNVSPPLQSRAKLSLESFERAAGGSFTASYGGSASQSCHKVYQYYFVCTTSLTGKGSGTFIHRSTFSGVITSGHRGSSFHCSAQFSFVSIKRPVDSFDAKHVSGCFSRSYEVTGGTGKFAHASGNGTATISIRGSTFTSSWKGTLYF
jgi:hypothetical protein